ncbi:MAG: P1 family peptidase, partial [Holophagales bacterium]|nr:P1 family peptidase [Holophagales bacterium]
MPIRLPHLLAHALVAPGDEPALGGGPPPLDHGLTAVAGLKVGHAEMSERPTGATAILVEDGAVAAVDVRGGGPGSRELALLEPQNLVRHVHAITLAGGSAFGLDAASGVMAHLESRGVGYETSAARVPIVPAAI